MKTIIWILGPILLLSLAACETPDLKPFAANTAQLSAAVSGEHEAVLDRLTMTGAKLKAFNADHENVRKIAGFAQDYEISAKKIEAVLDLAVDYSNALAELAKAGESGDEAANQIIDTFDKFTEAAGIAVPGAGAAGDIVADVFRAISVAVTRIQAQKSLENAMAAAEYGSLESENAKLSAGPIPAIESGIVDLLGSGADGGSGDGAQLVILSGVKAIEDTIAADVAGLNRVAFYKGMAVNKVVAGDRAATRLDHYFGALGQQLGNLYPIDGICAGDEGQDCLVGRSAEGLAAVVALVDATEESYRQYATAIAEAEVFKKQRVAAARKIVNAVRVWREEHRRIYEKLVECGGFSALDPACGNLNFANFQSAVEKLKIVAGKGGE